MKRIGKQWLDWQIIAGPCAAESENHVIKTAVFLSRLNVPILRAGIWKPRTIATDWQGPGEKAIEWMIKARKKTGIRIATEAKDLHTLKLIVEAKFDYIWVGSRNGQSYALLEEIGKATSKTNIVVILKRTMFSSLSEWIGAAGYITAYNPKVVLCERGIRGYSPDTRNILDLQTAFLARQKSGLPVIIDVSHAAGRRDLIVPMSLASKAAGLNGIMVEVHQHPDRAKTDALQQISFHDFSVLHKKLRSVPHNK